MRKAAFAYTKKKADQLPSNHTVDQLLCFPYIESTIPLLPESKILRPLPICDVLVQVCVARKTGKQVFLHHGSITSMDFVQTC